MEEIVHDGKWLNLGCGNKILKGWINVDKAVRGSKPDIDSDIRTLPFEDDYADKVMAIHVIEHFYQWEAEEVVNEWMRVLKPGGEIILECPNLTKAVEYIAKGIKDPQLTSWPIYGDPGHKDPLMCHKWGYTPSSLKSLLKSVGFHDVKRMPAQYHLREKRDMRVVGIC